MMIPAVDPIQVIKVLLITAVLAFVTWLWWDRGHAHEIIKQQQSLIAMHESADRAQVAEAQRKSDAYANAKRKADLDAKELRGRIAWLKDQNGKGCEAAQRVITEYRAQRP